jgi:hypothetical protein
MSRSPADRARARLRAIAKSVVVVSAPPAAFTIESQDLEISAAAPAITVRAALNEEDDDDGKRP